MKDRTPTKPGRVQLVPVAGQTNIYDMSMADEPTEVGTALNKANLLSDASAAAVWRGSAPADPSVSDALAELAGRNKILLDTTTTSNISSGGFKTETLADDIENYREIEIWIYKESSQASLTIDVDSSVNSNKRIAEFAGSVPSRYAKAFFVDNSASSHSVITVATDRNSSLYPLTNKAYSASNKLEGTSITIGASGYTFGSGARIIIIGHKF